jgi:hypothetical protein
MMMAKSRKRDVHWARRYRWPISLFAGILFAVTTTYQRFGPDVGAMATSPAPYVHALLMLIVFAAVTYFLSPPLVEFFERRLFGTKKDEDQKEPPPGR